MLVRPLSTADNTRDYARVSHSGQWSNYNLTFRQAGRRSSHWSYYADKCIWAAQTISFI